MLSILITLKRFLTYVNYMQYMYNSIIGGPFQILEDTNKTTHH